MASPGTGSLNWRSSALNCALSTTFLHRRRGPILFKENANKGWCEPPTCCDLVKEIVIIRVQSVFPGTFNLGKQSSNEKWFNPLSFYRERLHHHDEIKIAPSRCNKYCTVLMKQDCTSQKRKKSMWDDICVPFTERMRTNKVCYKRSQTLFIYPNSFWLPCGMTLLSFFNTTHAQKWILVKTIQNVVNLSRELRGAMWVGISVPGSTPRVRRNKRHVFSDRKNKF